MMGSHIENPVRQALRASILHCINQSDEALTVAEITAALGEDDAREVARLCYELRVKSGEVEFGDPRFVPAQGKPMKTYQVPSTDSMAAWAARSAASAAEALAQAPKQRKKASVQPAAPAHPWKKAVIDKPTPRPARITRDLPAHLHSLPPAEGHLVPLPCATTALVDNETAGDAPQTPARDPAPAVLATASPAGAIRLDFPLDQEDIDAALIDALKQVLPAMQGAAADLPKSTATPTPEAPTMTEPTATYAPDTDPGAAPEGMVWARQGAGTAPATFTATPAPDYIPDPDAFVLTPETELAGAPVATAPPAPGGCGGHCANHAREEEQRWVFDFPAMDDIERCRQAIEDAKGFYARQALKNDPVWMALERALDATVGGPLETCHG